jgi:hypothetical protein
MHRSKFHPYSITLSVRANEQRPRPAFEGIVDTLPALQDLAPVWHSLLAVTSDVTHIMIIRGLGNDHHEHVKNRPHCRTHLRYVKS